ncbi:MAG: zf-RING7 domain-containing protein [Nitrospira sp.]|nr:MAG: zf-RING7 domain-containing protein [Nitrospira sp.]
MNLQLSPLIELQKLDLRIADLKEQRRKIPERLEENEAPLREAKRVFQEASASVEALIKDRRTHEKDLEAHEDRVGKMKDRAAQLKTNQEYQAHLFEIELANKKRGDIEEKILLAMEQIEQTQRTIAAAQVQLKESEALFLKEKATLDGKDQVLAAELAGLEGKQKELSGRVEKVLLARYNKLKATRKDQALALIKNGICVGCRLQLPPQLISQVKRGDEVHTCPYCYRMLYWEGEPGLEEKRSMGQDQAKDLEVGESF